MSTIVETVETGVRIAAEARSAYVDSIAPIPERHEGPMTREQHERAEAQREWDAMPKRFDAYEDAKRTAVDASRILRADIGLERAVQAKYECSMRESGFQAWRIFRLHSDPNQRYGYEARCEVVRAR